MFQSRNSSIQEENNAQIIRRIEDWKCRLIDLSKRNNLLYYKQSKRGNLAVTSPEAKTVFNKLLLKQNRLEFWMPPEEETPATSNNQQLANSKPDRIENENPTSNQLVCDGVGRSDLDRILKNLHRRSLSDYRERGVRILHAAFGKLVWNDIVTSEEVHSPLVMVPIELSRETIRKPFSVSVPHVEDEAVLNPALLVKLKNDYKIDLPALPEDWEKDSLTNYLYTISQVASEHGWKVETTLDIGLFSFHKLVIYKDLDSNAQAIIEHPIVRAIAGVKDTKLIMDSLPEEKDVDRIESPEDSFRVLDADSSQRVSIDYALKGQSFVMQGPPGTGKSQTIANIIAECIARGKSVLFVSDKMAALEVVYKRLNEAGLSSFCLELHSSKANKQEVVSELKRCLDEQLMHGKLPTESDFLKMKQLTEQLNGYVAALHAMQPMLQTSAYEVLGKLAALQQVPFVQLGLSNPGSLTPQKIRDYEELVTHLRNVWQVVEEPEFPWRGYRGNRYNLEIRAELTAQLEQVISTINLLRLESNTYAKKVGLETPSSLDRVNWLIQISNLLRESPKPEAKWVTNPQIDQLIREAQAYKETLIYCQATRNVLLETYNSCFFDLMLNTSYQLDQALLKLENLINPQSIREGELLSKRESLLSLVKNTPNLSARWSEKGQELAKAFGLPTEKLTLERVKHLADIAALCFAEEKPEFKWFDPAVLQQTEQLVRKAKNTYQEYNALRNRVKKDYNDQIYELDLDGYIRRYSGYQSFLKNLNPSYHRDQKQIAVLTHQGKAPKTVLKDLLDAKKVKALKAEINSDSQTVQDAVGHFYKGYETDFQKAEKALEVASQILKLAGSAPLPENLKKLTAYPSVAPQEIRQLGNELSESTAKWERLALELVTIIPPLLFNSNLPINQTSLAGLEEYINETSKQLIPLYELTKEVTLTIRQDEPKNYALLIEDLKKAEELRRKEAQILNDRELLRDKFGQRFNELRTDWNEILSVLQWTKKTQSIFGSAAIPEEFAQTVSKGSDHAPPRDELIRLYEDTPRALTSLEFRFEAGALFGVQRLHAVELEAVHKKIKGLRERVDDLQVFIDFKDTQSRFSLAGLEAFFNRLVEQHPLGVELVRVFQRAVYQEWINNLYNLDSRLGRFRRENHEHLIAEFKSLDRELIKLSSNSVIQAGNSRKPQDILIQATDSEVNTLLKEASKKRRLMPIRSLLQRIPHILPKIKPCLLMSPISVSQFVDSKIMNFDLILFDEASQIVPEDAICSIYRGKCVVVAGDNKQLPPTSFFQKTLIDDIDWDEMTDADVEVFDSILDECLGIGLPVKTLRWHYRSRHEDLIAFSNNYFYDGNLITFPSAEANHHAFGVKLCHVKDGVYDRGGKRDNPIEAQAIADLVFDHFTLYPNKTLGVVTFSIAQMDAVEEAIENRLSERPEFEHFFQEDRLEGFFVKNLENVQGDERDVIMFSVGYGRDQQGTITMNFGPLNKPGGERRLNVAVTRAREKTLLVTSIKAADIDLESTNAAGVKALRNYLEYAQKGPETLNLKTRKTGQTDSPMEIDVAEEIRSMDFKVEPRVGCSDYRIDLGVIDPACPGSYLMGVEFDGPTYRSSSSTRDRDRLREQVLRQLGWKIHRIWSPAWVSMRESEIRRLKEALQQSCETKEKTNPQLAIPQEKQQENLPRRNDVRKVQFGGIEKIGAPYNVHPLNASYEPYVKISKTKHPYVQVQKNEFQFPANRALQSRILSELVNEEGPVHFDYAVQRLANAWGLKRVGPKITQAVNEAMTLLLRENKLKARGNFLWPPDLIEVPVRVPVINAPESKRLMEHIPPEEIENAMKLITQYSLGISLESLIVETAKVFGFSHASERSREVCFLVYQKMLRERKLVCVDDVVSIA